MLEFTAERSLLRMAPDAEEVDIGLNFMCSKTKVLNQTSKRSNDPSTMTAHEACFDFAPKLFILATRQ